MGQGSFEMKRVCVFLGSSAGGRPEYAEAAAELGRVIARRDLGLVYGGASVGLMAVLADAALAEGGTVIGVIPKMLVEKEIAHQGLADVRIVGSMHERKAVMADLADGFIALPGGLGTLEEFFKVWTWSQLGLHAKPCGLLDVCGYFRHLIQFLDHSVAERLLRQENRDLLLWATEPMALLDRFENYRPSYVPKWVGREET
jgi:uncharacterized protein (TIGR00730 family)